MFLYYANEESDEVIGGSTQTIDYERNSQEYLKKYWSSVLRIVQIVFHVTLWEF